ncbi:uncharacterized protein LOC135076661 [Ostrinia nubilalis]|uniref:uncharacterized protein LOC135076661 n=1 Tax=Ostrinia nubilalis TaxID=29057 RepID=UPI0030826971
MPKRRSESTVEFLSKKLKKLESEIKRCRRPRRRRLPSSASSSTSSSRSSSSSSSRTRSGPRARSTSRDSTPSEKHYDRHATEPTSPATPQETAAAQEPPCAASPPAQAAPVAPGTPHIATADVVPPPVLATEQADPPLDPEILDILGDDPTAVQKFGANINKDLANRFNHITTAGLDKEGRKLLIEKYLIPANCSKIAAPRLNPEIKAAVPDSVVRRDKAIEARQTEIAAAISCLSQAISNQLAEKHTNHELLKRLMDSARLMCDIQYSESISRRNFTLYSLKRDIKEQLTNAKIDTLLFGEDLPETIKTAKAVTKSSSDLKMDVPKKTNTQKYPSKTLNWKTGSGNRKAAAAGPSRRQPPAAASSRPPASSSRSSSQPQRSRQPRRH